MVALERKITIAGVDCTAKLLSFEIERPFGDAVSEATVEMTKSVDVLVTLSVGQTVKIYRNFTGAACADPDDLVFYGELTKFDQDGGKVKLVCKDRLYAAVRTLVSRSFMDTDAEAGKISEIFLTIITDDCGLTADATTVQDTGTTFVLEQFICNYANAMERLKALADSINYQFYYRPDTDKVYFEPKGYTASGETLTVGDEILKAPKWENDAHEMVNDLYVWGASQYVEYTEFFNGDGATKTFTLEQIPESIKVYISAALKRGGLKSVSTSADYTIDKLNKRITFGTAPAVGASNIEIRYTYYIPVPLHLSDDTSKTSYGRRQKIVNLQDIRGIEDATVRGRQFLSDSKDPAVYATLKVANHDSMGLQVGQTVRVVDSIADIDDTFTINRYVVRFPTDYDEVYVGPKEFRLADQQQDILNRLKRIEEEMAKNKDIVFELLQAGANGNLRRKTRTITQRYICDSFILNHPENGKLGQGIILHAFDATTGWAGTDCSLLADGTTYKQGAGSVKLSYTDTAFSILYTTSVGDISDYTGEASGTPSKGTIGLWFYTASADVTDCILRVGSSATDYIECGYNEARGGAIQAGWNYLTFDLDAPDNSTGTPDWTDCDYIRLAFADTSGGGDCYVDYLTVSKSNIIGLNGLGYRYIDLVVDNQSW